MSRPANLATLPAGRLRATEARGKRFVLVASAFHRPITQALVRGAIDVLRRHGASNTHISIHWVPGAFELPVAAARLAKHKPRPHAIIALGAIVRGHTPHYEVLSNAVAQGLGQVAVNSVVPVTFGVIVAKTLSQARSRADGAIGNRGAEAALAAIAVLQLFDRLDGRRLAQAGS